MGQIKLTKLERQNTYTATCDILLDGACIGRWDVTYAYIHNRFRVNAYWVQMNETGTAFEFQVDGTWETKAYYTTLYPVSKYETFQNGYKTSKEAKAAALAFITETVEAAEAAKVSEILDAANPVKLRNTNPQTTLTDGQTGTIIFGICLDDDAHYFNITGSDADVASQMFNLYRDRITDSSDEGAYWGLFFDDGVDAVQSIWFSDCNSTDHDRITSIMSNSRSLMLNFTNSTPPVEAAETAETVEAYVVDMPTKPTFSSFLWDMNQNAKAAAAASPLTLTIRFVKDYNVQRHRFWKTLDEMSEMIHGDIKQAQQMIDSGHVYSGYIQQQMDTLLALLPECF